MTCHCIGTMKHPRCPVHGKQIQTHSEECWRLHGHEACAARKVESLTAKIEQLLKVLWEVRGFIDGGMLGSAIHEIEKASDPETTKEHDEPPQEGLDQLLEKNT